MRKLIKHRKFLNFVGIVLLGCILSGCSPLNDIKNNRPNVLFIMVDDLNNWIEPLGGHPQAKTPNLQKFAEPFVRLHHAIPPELLS